MSVNLLHSFLSRINATEISFGLIKQNFKFENKNSEIKNLKL